ncbi:UDP-N-acetylmuramoyl-L-alanyl-D-glutamate--2,6-diaminopimelate ligase [Bacillus sp. ISL-35]|uniref:UDP-N-acetylmuramoyl-L-alanyl-D-glutamate--2, 6-diaminopimelate ligase n=1 Tax=Bacillus sp. ISL-35 TaxID=2819122 RepID=UPI001BE8754D|nr:UDP-N-acetylmuramoyl-L-alanyl-D-glutamate--2,6-diaminopimelate ligase [Bacillus sp. ISL-35]MBT2678299.1 UDP-N-acetylmuramoyl-L-alanyl-D-glutamate--2,6-diaminopimelate ligase [Bacillus sp. ISL-35]MBT2705977.1 UDP-N-acetylmuramoyl-L-alanyl-D-glutamate--2,6-diaminopimelate ligase [Chryseobacterium sp. ISL-80]
MRLSKVLEALGGSLKKYINDADPDLAGIQMDSRKVKPGDLFVAISGYQIDGHQFIQEAIDNGAAAVIGENELEIAVPYIQVFDSRLALGRAASAYYQHPSRKHTVIGITGTNGKTTVSYILKHILEHAGKSCSLLGTVSYIINNEVYKPSNTTPDALQIQELMANSNDEFVVLEVSSHALKQYRIEGLELDYGLFTNLSHDHLDYHPTIEDYFEAKTLMYNYMKQEGSAVVSMLTEWGEKLTDLLSAKEIPVYSMGNNETDDLKIGDIKLNGATRFEVKMGGIVYPLTFPSPGLHNVYNAAMAFLTAIKIGIHPDVITDALKTFPGVPGRFEMISHPEGATFIIDYAHTKDAIEYCLQAAQEHDAVKIKHIFGFRGERDKTKREHMVKASAAMSDEFILTFDDLNGVSEDEMEDELKELNERFGMNKGKVITDRTIAIQEAWESAGMGEWILITGKGPEEYQTIYGLPTSSDKDTLLYLQKQQDKEKIIG